MDIDCISGWANCIILTLKNPTKCKTISLVPRLLHRKTGREPGRFDHVNPWRSVRGFVRGFDNRIIAHAVWLKILPSIVKLQTIVAWVLDVAGTDGSAVLPFKLLVGYDKFSFYPRLVSRSQTLTRSRRSPCWCPKHVKALIAAHCDSKESFEGRYEQLWVLRTSSIKL